MVTLALACRISACTVATSAPFVPSENSVSIESIDDTSMVITAPAWERVTKPVVKAKEIIAVVPDARKAEAIKACFGGEITPLAPASILRTHSNATVYLDKDSAMLLTPETLAQFAASP